MSHNMCNMHKDVKRLIYNEETEQSYQKAIEQCCTKQFSTTIRSRLSLSSNLLPTLASVYRHWRCSSSATTASAPTFTYSREQRTDFSRLSSLMNMARLAAANDEDRPPRLENEVIKVINVWVSSQKRIQRMEWGTEKSKQNSPEKNLESILLFCLHSSKLCAASAAGENHWRAKKMDVLANYSPGAERKFPDHYRSCELHTKFTPDYRLFDGQMMNHANNEDYKRKRGKIRKNQ